MKLPEFAQLSTVLGGSVSSNNEDVSLTKNNDITTSLMRNFTLVLDSFIDKVTRAALTSVFRLFYSDRFYLCVRVHVREKK